MVISPSVPAARGDAASLVDRPAISCFDSIDKRYNHDDGMAAMINRLNDQRQNFEVMALAGGTATAQATEAAGVVLGTVWYASQRGARLQRDTEGLV